MSPGEYYSSTSLGNPFFERGDRDFNREIASKDSLLTKRNGGRDLK